MSIPPLPKRTIKLHTGSDPDLIPLPATLIRRLDVIVPAGSAREARLGRQISSYAITSGIRLSDVVSSPDGLRTSASVSRGSEDEAWFIDGQRGMLALKVPKERYQALGLAGRETGDAYIIQVDIKDKTTKLYARAKEAFENWDRTWEVWSVVGEGESEVTETALAGVTKGIEPERVVLEDILVPTGLPSEDEDDSWAALFEWVGMCTIGTRGSPRISSIDQVNPYISGYSAPEGSTTGSVARFRWEGLLSDEFIRKTIQVAREGATQGLVAFSLSYFDHVPASLPVAICEACAGVAVTGEWALAEIVAPI